MNGSVTRLFRRIAVVPRALLGPASTNKAVMMLIIALGAFSNAQTVPQRSIQDTSFHQYVGTYRWNPGHFMYLQMWQELSGKSELVAFDEAGDVRTLYPSGDGRFVAGPGAAIPNRIESHIEFDHDANGDVTFLHWQHGDSAPVVAQRIENEKREDIGFANGGVHLAGMLIDPLAPGKHPAVILVPASGAEDREYLLPFAHFLVRHGIAVFGYDKRGVGGSTGDWRTESFDDLASDAVAAFEFLKTRKEIDHSQIGMIGLSQAGWVMPVAAVRAKGIAFLISISGAGVPPAETTMDEARGEMTAAGMRSEGIEPIIGLMRLEYEYARTGQGWNEYAAAREKIVARMGKAPDTFPGSPNDSYWRSIRNLYFYDPAPTLRKLQIPVLAFFGELDDNILAEKNKTAWESALHVGGNRDYTLQILPKADHLMLEAKVGNNAEMPTLQRFSPVYFATLEGWLAKHIRGFK